MKGGTATEPNAVDSPLTRTGGRPPIPSENHPMRRDSSCHRIDAASARVGMVTTRAEMTGRRLIATTASGSNPANPMLAAMARAASPWFEPRMLAIPRATRNHASPSQVTVSERGVNSHVAMRSPLLMARPPFAMSD